MNYKKITKENYNIHIINNDRFKTVNVDVYFTKKADKKNISITNLLLSNLNYSNKNFNTNNKLNIEFENLYSLSIETNYKIFGSLESILFSLEMINPKYTEEDMLEKSLKLFNNVIFNPNVENNSFNKTTFEINKKQLISNLKLIDENPMLYSTIEYKKNMFKNTPASYSLMGTKKELESITPKKLYSFYKTLFNSYQIDIFVMGQIDKYEEKIINILESMFKDIKSKPVKTSIFNKVEFNKLNNIKEVKSFNQSQLFVGYKLKDLTENELYFVLQIYNLILGGINNSVLFTNLREKNYLCYSVSCSTNRYYPSISIVSSINKKNYKKSIELIKSSIKDMSNKRIIKPLYDSAIQVVDTLLNGYYDDPYVIIDHYYMNIFDKNIIDVEQRRKKLLNVSLDEVINLNKKLKLSLIYFLEGDKEK